MTAWLFFALVLCSMLGLYLYLYVWRDKWIRKRPFPDQWLAILRRRLPVYDRLTEEEQQRLQQLIKLFLARKKFYGCAGLEISDEMRVTIAAEACLLLLNQGWSVYPGLYSVLVYPSAFRVKREEHQANGTVSEEGHDLLGESWGNGRVILSWDDVEMGAADFNDGHNVVLHEFAHQLDNESGSTNGAPPLRRNSYKSWAKVFSSNFENLRERSIRQQPTVMDKYGATNPAEFFAVATESFFEQPGQLHARRPELYQELCDYYQLTRGSGTNPDVSTYAHPICAHPSEQRSMSHDWQELDFEQLDPHQLYALLRLRQEVFVVEQACIYQDMDDLDQQAIHMFCWQDSKLLAYQRCLRPGLAFAESALGRIVVSPAARGGQLGRQLVQRGIEYNLRQWPDSAIKIGAQAHLENFYASLGFVSTGHRYIEDGIPHLHMLRS